MKSRRSPPSPNAGPVPKTHKFFKLDSDHSILVVYDIPTELTVDSLYEDLKRVGWYGRYGTGGRMTVSFGNPGFKYAIKYKDTGNVFVHSPLPWRWFRPVYELKKFVEDVLDPMEPFQYAAVQYYESNQRGINPHKDLENDPQSPIVGVSFGATRTLLMCKKAPQKDDDETDDDETDDERAEYEKTVAIDLPDQ